jgi:hypothetical protein
MNKLACNTTDSSCAACGYDFTAIALGRKDVANAAWAPSAAKRAEVAAKKAAAGTVTHGALILRSVVQKKDGFEIE